MTSELSGPVSAFVALTDFKSAPPTQFLQQGFVVRLRNEPASAIPAADPSFVWEGYLEWNRSVPA
jgi:hypothetical protein